MAKFLTNLLNHQDNHVKFLCRYTNKTSWALTMPFSVKQRCTSVYSGKFYCISADHQVLNDALKSEEVQNKAKKENKMYCGKLSWASVTDHFDRSLCLPFKHFVFRSCNLFMLGDLILFTYKFTKFTYKIQVSMSTSLHI